MDEAADRRREELAARLSGGVLAPIAEARTAVAAARADTTSGASGAALDVVADELAGTAREVREIVDGSLRDLGGVRLHDALRTLASRHPTVEVSIDHEAAGDADADAETTLRFVAYELVTNALKHASAERVLVRLSRVDDHLVLVVSDDGCGGADADGSGIVGLGHRLEEHGGRLSIASPKGTGTTATASLRLIPPSSTAPR
jgi:signal transduction histidine kinase